MLRIILLNTYPVVIAILCKKAIVYNRHSMRDFRHSFVICSFNTACGLEGSFICSLALPAFGTSHSDGCQELSLPDSACEHPSAPPSPSLCHSVLKWALLGVIQRVGSPQFSKSNQILFIQESTSVCR